MADTAAVQAMRAADAADILQGLVAKYRTALAANPALAAKFLSEGEQLAGRAMNAANFGKALERAVGADVQANYPGLLRYVGGSGQPDFLGVGAASGRAFDITTFLQQAAHYARP
jgi:hypothetical protein